MCVFGLRYDLRSPIRLLLPVAGTLFVTPFVYPIFYNVIWFPILYFFASYFTFLNFPCIVETLHKKPMYFEDLTIVKKSVSDKTFQKVYTVIMSFMLALVFGIVSDYVLLQGIHKKSLADIIGIVGANVLVFMKVQNEIGRLLVSICHSAKDSDSLRNVIGRISNLHIERPNITNPQEICLRSKSCSDIAGDFVIDVPSLRMKEEEESIL